MKFPKDRTEPYVFLLTVLALVVFVIAGVWVLSATGFVRIQLPDLNRAGFSTGQEEEWPGEEEVLRLSIQELRHGVEEEWFLGYNPNHDFVNMADMSLERAETLFQYVDTYEDELLPEKRAELLEWARIYLDLAARQLTASGEFRYGKWMTTPIPMYREQ